MLLGVACPGRDYAGAKMFDAIMSAQTAREQAVAVGHGEDVVARDAIGCQTTRHTLAPHPDVLTRVAHNGGITRGAAGSVYTDNLTLRCSLQTKGIVVTQILLCSEGQLLDVLYGLNVIRTNVQLLQLIAVEGHIMIYVLHNFVKTFTLERAHLIAAHTFFFRIPNHDLLLCLRSW